MADFDNIQDAKQEALLETILLSDRQGTLQYLGDKLKDENPGDIANILPRLETPVKVKLLKTFPGELAADVLREADETSVRQVLEEMEVTEIDDIVPFLPVDDAADVLQELDDDDAQKVLDTLTEDQRESVREVLEYPDDSAGGIMTVDFLSMDAGTLVADAEREIKEHHKVEDNINIIYVTDSAERIQGFVSLRKLITSPDQSTLGSIMKTEFIHVGTDTDQEEVSRIARRYNLTLVPVTDNDMKLMGVITSDDIMEVFDEEHTEDLHKVAGVIGEGTAGEVNTLFGLVRLRLPWLLLTVIGQFISAAILYVNRGDLEKTIAVVFFVPVVMALSGNVGIQSAILISRGIATRMVSLKMFLELFWRELKTGVVIGLVLGAIIGVAAYYWAGGMDPVRMAMGISVACMVAVIASNLVGLAMPFLFVRLKIDPAVATGPLVTTANDILGLIIYFVMAAYFIF